MPRRSDSSTSSKRTPVRRTLSLVLAPDHQRPEMPTVEHPWLQRKRSARALMNRELSTRSITTGDSSSTTSRQSVTTTVSRDRSSRHIGMKPPRGQDGCDGLFRRWNGSIRIHKWTTTYEVDIGSPFELPGRGKKSMMERGERKRIIVPPCPIVTSHEDIAVFLNYHHYHY